MAELDAAHKAYFETGQVWDKLTPEAQQDLWYNRGVRPAGKPAPTPPSTPTASLPPSATPPAPPQARAIMQPATPAPAVSAQEREAFSWLPGAEALQVLPEQTRQRFVDTELLRAPELGKMAAALGLDIVLTAGGGALGALTGPFAGAGVPMGAMAGSMVSREIKKRYGLEEPGMTGDIVAAAGPLVPSLLKAPRDIAGGMARISRAGQALRDAQQKNMAAQQAAQEAFAKKQVTMYEEMTYKAQEAQRTYRQALQEYNAAKQAQGAGTAQARGIPGQFAPPQPASALYRDLTAQYGQQPVILTKAQEAAEQVQEKLGLSLEARQPGPLQHLATNILELDEKSTVGQVQQYLKDVGPLTRSSDSRIRAAAKQLYYGLQDALETAPQGRDALRAANKAARREFAVSDLEQAVESAISIGNDGLPRIAAGSLRTKVGRLLNPNAKEYDELFAGSFTPAERQQLVSNLDALAGIPQLGGKPPAQPGSIRARPPTYEPPATVEPQLKPPTPGRMVSELVGPTLYGMFGGHPGHGAIVGTALATADMMSYGISKLLLTPGMRPVLEKLVQSGGRVDPRALALFNAAVQQGMQAQPRTEPSLP